MKHMMSGKFTIKDMENQFQMMGKMGPMKQIMNMIPGLGGKLPKEASKMTEDKINQYKIIISSMKEEEKLNPKIIKHSRIHRIAKGSGRKPEEVKDLLKYYKGTKKAMKGLGKRGLGGGQMGRLMGQFMK
jgi:signal recognition particle subunit SRP54